MHLREKRADWSRTAAANMTTVTHDEKMLNVLQAPATVTQTVACGVPVEAAGGSSDKGLDELAAQRFADR